jgi:hypothetical protein
MRAHAPKVRSSRAGCEGMTFTSRGKANGLPTARLSVPTAIATHIFTRVEKG